MDSRHPFRNVLDSLESTQLWEGQVEFLRIAHELIDDFDPFLSELILLSTLDDRHAVGLEFSAIAVFSLKQRNLLAINLA